MHFVSRTYNLSKLNLVVYEATTRLWRFVCQLVPDLSVWSRKGVGSLTARLRAVPIVVRFPAGKQHFFRSPKRAYRLCGQLKILFKRYIVLFPREFRGTGCEVDQSSLSSVEVKNEWCYSSISPLQCLYGVHKGMFSFITVYLGSQILVGNVNLITPVFFSHCHNHNYEYVSPNSRPFCVIILH